MIRGSAIRLGAAAMIISLLLSFSFLLTGTPYAQPYTSLVWALQLGGAGLLILVGLVYILKAQPPKEDDDHFR